MASFGFTFGDRLRTLESIPSSRSVRLLGFAIHPCNLQPKRGCLAKRPIHLSRILGNSHLAWEWCVSFFMIFLCFSLCSFFADFMLVFPMVFCMCIFQICYDFLLFFSLFFVGDFMLVFPMVLCMCIFGGSALGGFGLFWGLRLKPGGLH